MARKDDVEAYISEVNQRPEKRRKASPTELGERLEISRQAASLLLKQYAPQALLEKRGARFGPKEKTRRLLSSYPLDTNETYRQIARNTGISPSAVMEYFSREGVRRGDEWWSQQRISQTDPLVQPHVGSEETVDEIFDAIGRKLSRSTISRSLRRQGENRGKGGPGRPGRRSRKDNK